MDSRMGATNNYEPATDLIQEDECDTLLLYLPGFTKEQLRVQLTSSGLKISGARPIEDNKWNSFQKNFPISENCDKNKISAKLEGGILYVRQPKLIVPAEKEVKKIAPPETARPPTPIPKIDQQSRPEKTTQLPEKSDKVKDEKPTKEEKSTDKKDERKYDQEKHDMADKAAGRITDDKSERPAGNIDVGLANKRSKDHDKGKKASGNVDPNLAGKGTKYHDIDGTDDYNIYAGIPVAKLKKSGRMITTILTALFAFLLGMYVRNMPWSSKNPGN